jgi:hypothetical protein
MAHERVWPFRHHAAQRRTHAEQSAQRDEAREAQARRNHHNYETDFGRSRHARYRPKIDDLRIRIGIRHRIASIVAGELSRASGDGRVSAIASTIACCAT